MQGERTRSETAPDVILWIEALAASLGCDTGTRTLEFRLEGGRFRSVYLHRGPIGRDELEGMFEWPEPPAASG